MLPEIRNPPARRGIYHPITAYAAIGAVCAMMAAPRPALADGVHSNDSGAVINGGGAVASSPVILAELALMNDEYQPYHFSSYVPVTSTLAQDALLDNDPTQFKLAAGSENVDFIATEQPLSATQTSAWDTLPTGSATAGGLIQVPIMGAGLAIVVRAPSITRNGQIVLSDNQLCAIFSGQITNWSQIPNSRGNDTITVVYRPDSAALSYQLTQHLAAVCNSSNSAFLLPITPSTYFASIFGSGGVPANFYAVPTLIGLATYMETTAASSAISYLSPDWTTIAPHSTNLIGGASSTLYAAALTGSGSTPFLPNLAGITLGLSNPSASTGSAFTTVTSPPQSATNAANPLNWLPLIPAVKTGYPIVSYSAMVLPQCFANPAIGNALKTLLKNHYLKKPFISLQNNNGYVGIAVTPAISFLPTVQRMILANDYGWNLDIGNKKACKHLAGR
jgi:ABC-type phosphate transport system substrate-binding protein